LEFISSNIPARRQNGELIYLTSKDSFVWAAVAAYIAMNSQAKRIASIEIQSAVYSAVNGYSALIEGNSSDIPFIRTPISIGIDSNSRQTAISGLDQYGIFSILANEILHSLEITKGPRSVPLPEDELNTIIQSGYQELLAKELLIDPVIEATIGLAVLGFIPFSFVKRTNKGQLEYRKIQATLWKYEMSRKRSGVETNITFEVARIAKALKAALVAGFHQINSSESDEPDEPPKGGVVV
jgi:hypothetical protein